jgi:membrane protein implicated in regulation of membrane protease activity
MEGQRRMPTISVPVEDLVFIICALVGGALLLVTVLVDDLLGGLLDALHIGFDIGGVSLMPLALGFVSMFGVGGLFATQVLDLHGGQAALVGTVSGAGGFGLVFGLFSIFRRAEGSAPFQLSDLVGRGGSIAVSIPAGRRGSVYVKAEGQTHEFSATASVDLASGTPITVTGVAGNGLVVAPEAPATDGGPHGA